MEKYKQCNNLRIHQQEEQLSHCDYGLINKKDNKPLEFENRARS
jgi:hypothetical protein